VDPIMFEIDTFLYQDTLFISGNVLPFTVTL